MNTRQLSATAVLGASLCVTSAQEAVRMSFASSQAAEARRKANTTLGYYNLHLGPTVWRFHANMGAEYNSNVMYREDATGDFILRPGFDANMRMPITEHNTLNLTLGAGYSFYMQESGLNQLYITPGSEISFDVYIGDVVINLHDRFTILQDSRQDPTIFGQGNYAQFENVVGTSALWDLNKMKLRAGYDHVNWIRISGDASRPDGQQEVFYFRPGVEFQPQMFAGVELGGALLNYDEGSDYYADGTQWNAGLFYEAPFSDYITVRASAGYTEFDADQTESNRVEDSTGGYVNLGIRHRFNQHLTYNLSASKLVSFGYHAGAVDMYSIRWDADWRVLYKIGLSTAVSYHNGEYLYGRGETFAQIGGSIGAYRLITEKLTGGLNYSVYSRDSNRENGDYWIHSIGLTARYAF